MGKLYERRTVQAANAILLKGGRVVTISRLESALRQVRMNSHFRACAKISVRFNS